MLHRDHNLSEHEDPNVKEHGHGDMNRPEFYNEHSFDAQFKRYAQVLDTDYDNFAVLYECFETAEYYNAETNERMPDYEAWEHTLSSSIDYSRWP